MGQATRNISPARAGIPGKTSELSVIIPLAGIGKRMRARTHKSLSSIDDETLIQKQINTIWHNYPKADILLTVGYQAEEVRNHLSGYPVRFIFNPIYEETNVCFSISLALQACITNKVAIIYGDLIFNSSHINALTNPLSKITCLEDNTEEEVGIVHDEKENVTNMSFGLPKKWGQITFLEGKELEIFKQVCYNSDTRKWFGYEALNEVINRGGTIKKVNLDKKGFFEVDTQQDLDKAKEYYK